MAEFEAEFGVLNVVANPHPEGIYVRVLEWASGRAGVNFWGDHYAAITSPTPTEEGIYVGRIVLWTKIDENDPAIDLTRLEEVPVNDTGARLPKDIGFNGRIFSYFFNHRTHLLLFEIKNEFGKRLSVRRCEKIFTLLLSAERLPDEAPLVEVTAVPEDESLDLILSIPRLDRIGIHLRRPNPDEFDDEVGAILRELEDQGAKSQDVSLVRAPGSDGIVLNERNGLLARVAAWNGYVEGAGHGEDGGTINGSTKAHPKIVKDVIDAGTSLAAVAIRLLRDIRPPRL